MISKLTNRFSGQDTPLDRLWLCFQVLMVLSVILAAGFILLGLGISALSDSPTPEWSMTGWLVSTVVYTVAVVGNRLTEKKLYERNGHS